jgi:hypothetical protein
LIKIQNDQQEDVGHIGSINATSKFIFSKIHESEGVTGLHLSEVDMDGIQAIRNLGLGEAQPVQRVVTRKNPYHPPATIASIENLSPERITVDEKDAFFSVMGKTPGDAEVEFRFETGERTKTIIKVTSVQLPGLSSKVFWPMLGTLRLPQGYTPSPRDCFIISANQKGRVEWLMTNYVHDVQIRHNGVIKALVPTVLEKLQFPSRGWKVDFSVVPYTCTRNVLVDTMDVSLPQKVGEGLSGNDLDWFFAEEENSIRQTSFTPAVAGGRNYVLKARDYLGEYSAVRVKHSGETSYDNLLLSYEISSWNLQSELKNHLQIIDRQDGRGIYKRIRINQGLRGYLPARYEYLPWNAESEKFYSHDPIQNQLGNGVVEFKLYRNYKAPTYDTIFRVSIGELPEIKIPISFDSNLDLKQEILSDTELHFFKLNGGVVSMSLQLPSTLEELPRYDWRAKLRLGGITPFERTIPTVSGFNQRRLRYNIALTDTPSVAHVEVAHPFQRPIRQEINIFSHESNWSWVDETYLNHKLVRYCHKFQKRIALKSSSRPAESELYRLDTSPANPFGYPSMTYLKRHLVGDSVGVQDYSFIIRFSNIKGSEPELIRLISIEDLEKELECESMIFGISSGWQNEGEAWRDKKHFEEDNTSIIFSASEIPSDETSMSDGMYTLSSPGVYLMLAKLGPPQWYCAQPEHIEDKDWPEGFFGCYGAVLEIEVF